MSVVAAVALQPNIEKRWFGGQYIRLGPLYMAVGSWLFQQGGVLGYALRGHPKLLGKLLGADADKAADLVELSNEPAGETVSEAEESSIFHLYLAANFRTLDIDLAAASRSKNLGIKVSLEQAYAVMVLAFFEGAAIGYHCPETLLELWENLYSTVPDARWQRARGSGLAISEAQPEELDLQDRIVELTEAALEWSRVDALGILDDSERKVLQVLATTEQ